MGGTTLVKGAGHGERAVAQPSAAATAAGGPAGAQEPPPPPDAAQTPPHGLSPARVRMVFVGLMLALLLAALEQMIVATALPKIVGELHGLDKMSWAITAYLLTSTVGLPIYGKLGDLFGRKGVFQFAIVVFVIGSALAGWSRTMEQLIAFRALQGVGAGGLLIGRHRAAPRAGPLHGHDRCRLRPGLRRGPPARRLLHRPCLLALVLLLQRAVRPGHPPRRLPRPEAPQARGPGPARRARRAAARRRLHLPGAPDQLGRHGVRLGLTRHPGPRRRSGCVDPALPPRRAVRGRTDHSAAPVP
ncbi:hypothetical protein STRAU_5714 [Streptomyces aurantiacus JA 4570]|uniref:Major facilitator superfamily (MFS) profile domain-containing protein n=1 Tax=Streptomyces aurantiacus JA 4570 TaxID=1286094 RepID=S4AID8_9ACTN|nr:hypothetical protein STRAU_5714 [Streptomyces aurantiacus JA 4570]